MFWLALIPLETVKDLSEAPFHDVQPVFDDFTASLKETAASIASTHDSKADPLDKKEETLLLRYLYALRQVKTGYTRITVVNS